MLEFLEILEIIISILLILIILVSPPKSSVNLTSMSSNGWWMEVPTKRWPEKIIFNITKILWLLFIINSILLFIVNK